MALETLSSSEIFNFVIYDTISATPYTSTASSEASFLLENKVKHQQQPEDNCEPVTAKRQCGEAEEAGRRQNYGVQGRKKRKRKARICKSKQQAETQRMTHIAVERNRRRQMNEHLAVLRSLMPDSYVQRGDQASIVGGAIEFVKELEHLLQSLETQKLKILQATGITQINERRGIISKFTEPSFAQFFVYPQYTCSQPHNNKHTSKTKDALADIEVTLIETHANLRILLRRRSHRQLSTLVAGFETLSLTILHLNVTSIDSTLVLYSISAKVEEGCQLGSADDIATAVQHLLRGIEEEASLCC